MTRLTDFDHVAAGIVVWLGLRWYPALLACYAGGMGALSRDDYANLSVLLTARVGARQSRQEPKPVAVAVVDGIMEAERTEIFKTIPGHEQHLVPRSEYLFKMLQPRMEDLLFLGSSFEDLFDRFEIFLALVHTDLDAGHRYWGPKGRFAWKFRNRLGEDPYTRLVTEAEESGPNWAPLEAGLFGGSIDRFTEVANGFRTHLQGLTW